MPTKFISTKYFINTKEATSGSDIFDEFKLFAGKLGKDFDVIIRSTAKKFMTDSIKELKKKHTKSGAKTLKRSTTGSAFDRITTQIKGDRTGLDVSLRMPARLWIHESGGTISAKAGKYLAIPIAYGLNSRGRAKFKSPVFWKDAFVVVNRRGNLFIMLRTGRRSKSKNKYELLYSLVKKVYIPPRLGLFDLLTARLPKLGFTFVDEARIHLARNRR